MIKNWNYERACVVFSFSAGMFSLLMLALIWNGNPPSFLENADIATAVFSTSVILYVTTFALYRITRRSKMFLEVNPFLIFSISMIVATKGSLSLYIILGLAVVVACIGFLNRREQNSEG